jgi:hypothetical protein
MREESIEINKINKQRIFTALREIGAVSVGVDYHGSHKSGNVCVESLRLKDKEDEIFLKEKWPKSTVIFTKPDHTWADGNLIRKLVDAEADLTKAIEDLAGGLLDQEKEGWCMEEGSSGSMIFSVDTEKITIKHTEFFIDSTYSESEIQ